MLREELVCAEKSIAEMRQVAIRGSSLWHDLGLAGCEVSAPAQRTWTDVERWVKGAEATRVSDLALPGVKGCAAFPPVFAAQRRARAQLSVWGELDQSERVAPAVG